jgi:large subunit ribosomal protein L31
MKKDLHTKYYTEVEVSCMCGATFVINAAVPGPVKVETCSQCHPAFNKNKEVKKVVKGRMEKYLEKQKRIEEAQKKAA